jgi:pantoate kinase
MSVTATAPGSVTTIFVPQDGEASLGVSFATADGARATVSPASATTIVLDGDPASVAPVSDVLRRLGITARVEIETEVPIGCGFGVSGAATLATALAANQVRGLGHDRARLVEAAHRAEVAAGTGLGDVFIQDRGGLVWDQGEGLRRIARTDRVQYTAFGGIATADVLGDQRALRRVEKVGREVLSSLDPRDGLAPLFEASWGFARRTGLVSEQVEAVVADVQRAGGTATMAMVGETVLSVDGGPLDGETRVTPDGATLC